jgi:energy-coupling factor transporter ATP-binding protein EcfA2
VFVGDNGSGKTTLMRAIAIALAGRDTANKLQANLHGWIKQGTSKAGSWIQLNISRVDSDDGLAGSGRKPDEIFPARLALTNGGKEVSIAPVKPSGIVAKNYSTPERTIWSTEASGWFACGYGPFRRVFGASSEATESMFGPLTGRFATMFNEAASLRATDQWLRELDHRQRSENAKAKALLSELKVLLNDSLLPNDMRVHRIDADGLWLIDRNGVELDWGRMSDGYRSMLALLCDILKQMSEAYPGQDLLERDTQQHVVVNKSGVVLIDEVDSHLHPEWQREIGLWLVKHFPRVQFIITTHSPLVCQAASPNGIFHLPEPGSTDKPYRLTQEAYERVIASTADTVLLKVFDMKSTRSPRADEGRKQWSRLQAKRKGGAKLNAAEKVLEAQTKLFVLEEEEA